MNLFLRIALLGLAVTAVAAAVIYFKLLGLVPTALLAATLLLSLFLHSRQAELAKELKAIKARSGNLEVYEQDIHKRLGALEVGLAGIKNGAGSASGAQNEKLAKLVDLLQHRVSAVENGTVTQFEKIPASNPKSIQAQPVAEQAANCGCSKTS